MDVFGDKIPRTADPAQEIFYKAYTISYWDMRGDEAKDWLDAQFGG